MATTFGAALGQLILQKRKVQGLTQLQLAEDAYGEPGKTRRISELENGIVANPHPTTIDPIISALNISDEELALCAKEAQYESDSESKDLFAALARQFDEDFPDSSLEELNTFLHQKAEEWRSFRERLSQLESNEEQLRDLLLDAERLLASAKFDEADAALKEAEERYHSDQVNRVLQTSFDIRIARGDSQLMAGQLGAALEHYKAAAEYFKPFDYDKMVSVLDDLAGQFYETSRRSLTPVYEIASGLVEHLISLGAPTQEAVDLAKYQYRLGLIYRNAYEDTRKPRRRTLLDKAITAAMKAVEISKGLNDGYQLACAKVSLANCLRDRVSHDGEDAKSTAHEAIKLLEQAKDSIELENREKQSLLTHIHNNLGAAFRSLATLSKDGSQIRYDAAALDHFEKSAMYSAQYFDADTWAGSKMNIGLLLWEKANASSGSEVQANFLRMRALAELVSANEAIPETQFPIRAANLNYYMGQLLHEIATKGQSFDLAEVYMMRSLNALFSAELVFDRECHAQRWADIQMTIAYVYANHSRIADPDTAESDLDEALARVQAAADQFADLSDEENAKLCKRLIRDLQQAR